MAHSELSDKLDYVSRGDLRISFDDESVWGQIQDRLTSRRRAVWLQRVVAVVTLALVAFPFHFQQKADISSLVSEKLITTKKQAPVIKLPSASSVTMMESQPMTNAVQSDEGLVLVGKRIEAIYADLNPTPSFLARKEIPIIDQKQLFAAKDISVIQASLEKPSIEQGRTMTIRAKWPKSPTKSNVEFQALKLKLYEKDE